MVSSELGTLAAEHKRSAVLALAIASLVRLMKADGGFPFTVPPRWRPCLALGLGAIGGAVDAITTGLPLPRAVLRGLGSGCFAIAAHDTVIEGLRGGRELFASAAGRDNASIEPAAPPFPAMLAGLLAGAHSLVAVGRQVCQHARPRSVSLSIAPARGLPFRVLVEVVL